MRRVLRVGLVAVIALIGAVAVDVQSASAATPTVTNYFQVPEHSPAATNQGEVAKVLAAELSTWQHAHVYISMFNLKDDGSRSADPIDVLLNQLTSQGDYVHVVLDQANGGKAKYPRPFQAKCSGSSCVCDVPTTGKDPTSRPSWSRAAARLWCLATNKGTKTTNSPFHVCRGACIGGSGGIDHNKFMIIEPPTTINATPIVVQESANWTTSQFEDKFQTITVIKNDQPLVDAYLNYWHAEYANNKGYEGHADYTDSQINFQAEFFPRKLSQDQRYQALQKARCSSSASTTTTVEITSNVFGDDNYVSQLEKMAKAGCDVRVVVPKSGDAELKAHAPHVHLRCNGGMHSKDLVVDGTYAASGTDDLAVFTGSRPEDGGTDNSDNIVLREQGSSVVAQYESQFSSVWNAASTVSC